jgi:hypothetical protein
VSQRSAVVAVGHSRLCVAVTSGSSSNIGLCKSLDGADVSGCSPCWR